MSPEPGTPPGASDDRGEPDPALAAALGADDVAAVLERLPYARLLVPVVALQAADADAEMSVPRLVGGDGRTALPVFSGIAALTAWRPDARPVPMTGARVLAGAEAEGYDAVVLDIGSPAPVTVTGSVLTKLAAASRQLLAC